MANTLWLQNGKLIVDPLGSPLLCSTCPCTPLTPATYYFYKQLIIAGCEGLQYRSNVVQFDPSPDEYSVGWNVLTTYMSLGDCSSSLVLYGTDGSQIDASNIGGLFSLCLGDLLLAYIGRPTSYFLYSQLYSDATGIWPTLKQLLLTIYSAYSASTDDSGDGSSGAVHPDILAMFPLNTIYDLFSTAADRLKEKARNLAQSTDDIWETLNSLALAVYSQYYNPAGSTAYNTYKLQYYALSAAHKGSIVGTLSTDDTESTDGIWQYYVIAPFAKLTYDTALLMANILNDTAVVNAKSTLSSYTAPKYSDVIYYQPGAGIGRYTYGVDAIVQAIQNCRDNTASLLDLETVLSTLLDPYSSSMSLRAYYLALTYRSAKIGASDSLCLSMLNNFDTGTTTLRQALWALYQTLVLKFVNAVLHIRPIRYTWAVLKTTTLLLPEKGAYTLPTSLLDCAATYSYKKYIWYCNNGMKLNKVYTAVPDLKIFNNDSGYLLLWKLQQMVAAPGVLFKLWDLLFTSVKGPLSNIDSFVYVESGSVWGSELLGLSTLISPVGLDAYSSSSLLDKTTEYYLWGTLKSTDPISELPLVGDTLQLKYDFTTISAPVYVLCTKLVLLDMTPDISPMGYADTWTYKIGSITGIVKKKDKTDLELPTEALLLPDETPALLAKTKALLSLLTDLDNLPTNITVFIGGVLVKTGYQDTSAPYWRNTGLYAELLITEQDYAEAPLSTLHRGYKKVTKAAKGALGELVTVVIRAIGLDKCSSISWLPRLTYHTFTPTWLSSDAVTPYPELEQNPYLTYSVEASQSPELVDLNWNPVIIKTMPSMTVTADLLSLLPPLLQ